MLWKILLIGTWKDVSYISGRASLFLYVGSEVAIDFLIPKFNQDV